VRHGGWDPAHDSGDRRNRDALAARGYWQSFQLVKKRSGEVIAGENAAALVRPCTTTGIASCPALRHRWPARSGSIGRIPEHTGVSARIALRSRDGAVRDAMPAFFNLLEKERSLRCARCWALLFGYIHRTGRERPHGSLSDECHAGFGRFPWTVIRIRDRKSYLGALDRASIEMDIHPFANFIDHRVQWRLERHD